MEVDWGIVLGFVGAVGVAAAPASVGLTMVATTPGEFRFVRGCFWASAILGAAAIFGAQWVIGVPLGSIRLAATCIAGAALFGGVAIALDWVKGKEAEAISSQANTPAPLLASQIEEMKQLAEFLGSAQESPQQPREDQMRKLFDFPLMLKFNLMGIRSALFPGSLTPQQLADMGAYFGGSVIVANMKYMDYTTLPDGTYQFHMDLNKAIPFIRVSAKYDRNRKRLEQFGNSVLMPAPLQKSIAELDQTVSDNANSFVPIMNEILKSDRNNFLRDQEPISGDPKLATNIYWSKFLPLAPKADKIIQEIRAYLNLSD